VLGKWEDGERHEWHRDYANCMEPALITRVRLPANNGVFGGFLPPHNFYLRIIGYRAFRVASVLSLTPLESELATDLDLMRRASLSRRQETREEAGENRRSELGPGEN